MIKKDEILMGRDKSHANEFTKEIDKNIDKLLLVVNEIRKAYGKSMTVSSGWRPPSLNKNVSGAATKSVHTIGLAVDISDPKGELRQWVLNNLSLMKKLGVYLEDFRWTPTWVHFQIVPPKSGKRIFLPYADTIKNPPLAPNAWNGQYDPKFD